MEEEGIQAITTSCGFNAVFQTELSKAVPVPVFTSALLQIPFIKNLIGDRPIGVLTANGKALTRKHFTACKEFSILWFNIKPKETALSLPPQSLKFFILRSTPTFYIEPLDSVSILDTCSSSSGSSFSLCLMRSVLSLPPQSLKFFILRSTPTFYIEPEILQT